MSTARLFVSVTAVMMLLTGVAHAGDPLAKPTNDGAQKHLTAGNRHYRVREFDKAIDEYKAGALKEDAPVFLYNLGQCYRQLGRYEDAIWQYERFLDRASPDADLKSTVEGFIKQMKDELAKKAKTQPPVEPGPTEKPQVLQPVIVLEGGEPWYADASGWVIAGAGLASAGTSIALLLNAERLDDDANGATSQSQSNELHARAADRRLLGTVFGVAGGIALVSGIVKLYIHPRDRERRVKTSISIGPSGFTIAGRF